MCKSGLLKLQQLENAILLLWADEALLVVQPKTSLPTWRARWTVMSLINHFVDWGLDSAAKSGNSIQ